MTSCEDDLNLAIQSASLIDNYWEAKESCLGYVRSLDSKTKKKELTYLIQTLYNVVEKEACIKLSAALCLLCELVKKEPTATAALFLLWGVTSEDDPRLNDDEHQNLICQFVEASKCCFCQQVERCLMQLKSARQDLDKNYKCIFCKSFIGKVSVVTMPLPCSHKLCETCFKQRILPEKIKDTKFYLICPEDGIKVSNEFLLGISGESFGRLSRDEVVLPVDLADDTEVNAGATGGMGGLASVATSSGALTLQKKKEKKSLGYYVKKVCKYLVDFFGDDKKHTHYRNSSYGVTGCMDYGPQYIRTNEAPHSQNQKSYREVVTSRKTSNTEIRDQSNATSVVKNFGDQNFTSSDHEETSSSQHHRASDNIKCLNCGKNVRLPLSTGRLGSIGCNSCNTEICLKCRKAFHGFDDCSKPQSPDKASEVVKEETYLKAVNNSSTISNNSSSTDTNTETKRNSKDLKHNPPVNSDYGAEAREYESEFYSKKVEEVDVTTSFKSIPYSVNEPFPWDNLGFKPGETTFKTFPRLMSLAADNWVEDELLEDAIRIVASQAEKKTKISVLESFVVKFALTQGQTYDELIRIAAEKKICESDITLALVNSDFTGMGGHWILATIFIKDKVILVMDSSLVISETYYRKTFYSLLKILHVSYGYEGKNFNPNEWKLVVCLDTVQQNNAYDCGPLAVCNAYAILNHSFITSLPKETRARGWVTKILAQDLKKKQQSNQEQNNKADNRDNTIAEPPLNDDKMDVSHIEPFKVSGLVIKFRFMYELKDIFKNYSCPVIRSSSK